MTDHIGNDSIQRTESGAYRAWRQGAWWCGDYDTYAAAKVALGLLNGKVDYYQGQRPKPQAVIVSGKSDAAMADALLGGIDPSKWIHAHRAAVGDAALIIDVMYSKVISVAGRRDLHNFAARSYVMRACA